MSVNMHVPPMHHFSDPRGVTAVDPEALDPFNFTILPKLLARGAAGRTAEVGFVSTPRGGETRRTAAGAGRRGGADG